MTKGMTRYRWLFALAFVPAAALPRQSSRTALASETFAITNVSVIPMSSDTVIRDATVIVRDGRIASIAPATRAVQRTIRRIDGRGMFLIPGLSDMHTHLYSDDPVPDSLAPHELGVLLATGVTSARLMIGKPAHLVLRKDVTAGRVLGPQLWIASPQLTGRKDVNAIVITTPDEARAAVASVAAAGYDFVKLTNFVSQRDVYDAMMAESKRLGIRVDGHVEPAAVGVPHALASGQHLQHLDGYLEAVLADSSPVKASLTQFGVGRLENWRSMDFIDDRKVEWIAGLTARSGVWVTPTLALFNTAFAVGQSDDEIRARPEWALMPKDVRDLYLRANARQFRTEALVEKTDARRRRYVQVRNRLVKSIVDSGGRILAGSDTPEWFMGYGYQLHRELEAFVAAGLTPYQALVSATRAPAEFLGASAEWGTIEAGKRADLVLLSGNPLADIRASSRIVGVSIGGRWLDRPALDKLLESAERHMRPYVEPAAPPQ